MCGGTSKALESHRPKRGRRRTPESVAKRLAAIDEQLPTADPLTRLRFAQERIDLEQELGTAGGNDEDFNELEPAFIEVAAAYGERKGLTYEAVERCGTPSAEGRRHRAGTVARTAG